MVQRFGPKVLKGYEISEMKPSVQGLATFPAVRQGSCKAATPLRGPSLTLIY